MYVVCTPALPLLPVLATRGVRDAIMSIGPLHALVGCRDLESGAKSPDDHE